MPTSTTPSSSASARPRILYVTASSQIGGAEASLLRLIEGLQARGGASGVEVAGLICLAARGPLATRAAALGLRVECLPVTPLGALGRGTFRRVRALIESFRPDIVQTYGLRADVAARRAAKTLSRPARLVSSIRSPDSHRRWHHSLLDRATARHVDRFISNSLIGKWSRVVREGFAPARIAVIPNGITPPPEITAEQRAAARLKCGVNNAPGPIIAMIANIRPMKGHGAVIEAARTLRARHPDMRIVCAGRDESDGAIPAQARAAGIDDVMLFPGFLADPWPLLAIADYLLLPSAWEGCPASILEAQIAGVPVIANNAGGIPELVQHGETGWLLHEHAPRPDLSLLDRTPPPSAKEVRRASPRWKSLLAPRPVAPAEIVSAIDTLQSNPPLRGHLAATAQTRTYRDFTLERMTTRHVELYLSL